MTTSINATNFSGYLLMDTDLKPYVLTRVATEFIPVLLEDGDIVSITKNKESVVEGKTVTSIVTEEAVFSAKLVEFINNNVNEKANVTRAKPVSEITTILNKNFNEQKKIQDAYAKLEKPELTQ